MPTSDPIRKLFDNRYASKTRILHGKVTSAPVDSAGRSVGYVIATVAGQPNITVLTDRDGPHYASYDEVEVLQEGDAANATYYVRRRMGGGRPTQSVTQFTEPVSLGDIAYAAGDIAMGDVTGSSPLTVVSSGSIVLRDGSADVISLVASTCSITVGNVARPNVHITPTRMSLRATTTERIRLDSSGSGFLASNNIWWDTAGNFHVAGAASIGGWVVGSASLVSNTSACTTGMYSGTDANTPAFWSGGANPATASFRAYRDGRVYANSACIAGQINATSGSLGALSVNNILTVGSGATTIKIDGSSGCIGTSDFVPDVTGWRIAASTAEFNNITARGSIHTPIFVKDLIEAHAGTLIVAKSAGKITGSGYTVGSTLVVEDPPGGGWLFATNDIVRIKGEYSSGVGDTWVTVTRTATTNQYTTVRNSGTSSMAYPAGVAAIDYGPSGQGFNLITGDLTNAPYYSIQTHAGAPWTTTTERVRLGNLAGLAAPATGYGLWTDNGYFTGHLKANSGSLVDLAISGSLTIAPTGGIYQGTGTFTTPTTGVKIWNSGGIGRIASYSSGASQVGFGTDGKFYAGGGKLWMDYGGLTASGVSIILQDSSYNTYLTQEGASALFYVPSAGIDAAVGIDFGGNFYAAFSRANNYLRVDGGLCLGTVNETMPDGSLKISGCATIGGGLNTGTCALASTGGIRASGTILSGGDIRTAAGLTVGNVTNAAATGNIITTGCITVSGGLNAGTATSASVGDVAYSGHLKPNRGAGTGYVFVPLTSRYAVLDGAQRTEVTYETVTLDNAYIPAQAVAIAATVGCYGPAGAYVWFGPNTTGTNDFEVGQNALSTTVYTFSGGIIPTTTGSANATMTMTYSDGTGGTVYIVCYATGYFI